MGCGVEMHDWCDWGITFSDEGGLCGDVAIVDIFLVAIVVRPRCFLWVSWYVRMLRRAESPTVRQLISMLQNLHVRAYSRWNVVVGKVVWRCIHLCFGCGLIVLVLFAMEIKIPCRREVTWLGMM